MIKSWQRLMATLLFVLAGMSGQAQTGQKETKPYKLISSGRQITIKSSKPIQHVMIWTTSGDRVVEQRGINNHSFSIEVPVNRKTFFLMVGIVNGKVYTEKIGMQ